MCELMVLIIVTFHQCCCHGHAHSSELLLSSAWTPLVEVEPEVVPSLIPPPHQVHMNPPHRPQFHCQLLV